MCSLHAADSPPYLLMDSPYAGMSYAELHDIFNDIQKMKSQSKVDWNDAPYIIGRVSVSQGTAARCLQTCEVVTPCAICCMASYGCSSFASILAIICGLRKVSCIKNCCKFFEPIPFEDSKRGKILRLQLHEIQKEMACCPIQEQKEFAHNILSKKTNMPSRSSSCSPAKEKMD